MRYLQMLVAMAICGVMIQGCFAALPARADINAWMTDCGTLMRFDMQAYLIKPNFNINVQRPSDGATGLMLAAKNAGKGGYWIVVDLLDHGANPYIKDFTTEKKTALEWAIDCLDAHPKKDLILNLWAGPILMVLDKLLHAVPIDWAAVDAAREYAGKASGGIKAGYGKIVDYLSGEEVTATVPERDFFEPPKDRSHLATTGEEAFLPKTMRRVIFKLPTRETVATPPSQDEIAALKQQNAELQQRIEELEKAGKAKPKSTTKKQPQKRMITQASKKK